MARSAKNKMKAWRKNSPGDGQGRAYLAMTQRFTAQKGGLTTTLMGLFAKADIGFIKPEPITTPTIAAE